MHTVQRTYKGLSLMMALKGDLILFVMAIAMGLLSGAYILDL